MSLRQIVKQIEAFAAGQFFLPTVVVDDSARARLLDGVTELKAMIETAINCDNDAAAAGHRVRHSGSIRFIQNEAAVTITASSTTATPSA